MKKSFALFFTATVLTLFGLFTVSAAAYTFTPGSEAVVYVDGAAGSNSNTGAAFSSDAGASRYGTGHWSYVQNDHDGSFWMYFHANPSLTVSAARKRL